jgi:dihydrofolate reductase
MLYIKMVFVLSVHTLIKNKEITMEITPKNYRQFKAAYKKALKAGKEIFIFGGHEVLVSYAKYLIQYLDGEIARRTI